MDVTPQPDARVLLRRSADGIAWLTRNRPAARGAAEGIDAFLDRRVPRWTGS